jgi:hypothetical protein
MRAQPIDRRIADLLNDPLTSLIMQADGVDRVRLAAQLRRIAESPRAAATVRRDQETSWNGFGLLSAGLCGACMA